MDGKVIISTDLNTSPLEKKLQKLEARLKKEEVDLDIKYGNADVVINELRKAETELDNLKQKQKEVNKETEEFFKEFDLLEKKRQSGSAFSGAEAMRYDSLYKSKKPLVAEQEQINNAVSKQADLVEKVKVKLSQAQASYEKQELKVEEINKDILETKGAIAQANAEQNKGNIDLKNIGNSMESIVKKVAKWGLAVFSIRSAYTMVRQAVSTLSQYNKNIGADIEYIRWVLATALKPVIEAIVNLAYKLITYIVYIGKGWGLISKNADFSAKAFQKANKGVKDTNKSTKQLQKTLAGFDEMNILQENGSVASGGGGGGVSLPTQDLENIEIPKWIDDIAKNGELIKNIIIGIGEAFLTWKLLKWASELGVFAGGLSEVATLLKVAGFVAIAVGIIGAVEDIINLIRDPSWDTFYQLIEDLSLALVGLGAVLIGINTSNPFGWITLAIGGLGLLISALGDSSDANEDLAKKTKSVAQAEEDLETAREARTNASKKYAQAIKDEEKTLKALEKAEKKNKISGEKLHQEILVGVKNYKDLTPAEREVYDAYLDHLSASEKLTKATETMTEATWDEKQAHHELTGAVYNETKVYDDWFQTMIDGYRNNSIEAGDMADAMKTAMNEMSDTARKDFINNLPDDIREAFNYAFDGVIDSATGTTVDLEKMYVTFKDGMKYSYKELGDTSRKFEKDTTADIANVAKRFGTELPNSVQKSIDKVNKLKDAIKNLGNAGISGANALILKIQGITGKGNAKGAIYYPPKLAVGGIINQPGRGVPLAMGGERGAEGVIPLTDSQAMSTLGQVIAKNISINLNNTVEMNGRVISRELKQIQNEEDFAFNGG